MSQYLLISEFVWLNDDEVRKLCILSLEDESKNGYILEVDLDYHDYHNDLPFFPDNKIIPLMKQKKLIDLTNKIKNYVMFTLYYSLS